MALIITLLFTSITCIRILRHKNVAIIMLIYCLVGPVITVGSHTFESIYLLLTAAFICVFIRNRGIVGINKEFMGFVLLTVVWIVTYFIGWLSCGGHAPNAFLLAIIGLLKTVTTIYVLINVDNISSVKQLDQTIGTATAYTLILNVGAVIIQWLFPTATYGTFYTLYYSASNYATLENINMWEGGFYKDSYYRYFGLFDTPMNFSCFLIFVLILFLVQVVGSHTFFKHPKMIGIVSVILGMLAGCKIFMFMIAALVAFYLMYSIKKLTPKKAIIFSSVLIIFIVFFLNINRIVTYFAGRGGIAGYLVYLQDPIAAFTTRFGNNTEGGFLTETMAVAMNHLFTGVGPVSIAGEPIADSSYVTILHNGGIIALFAMVVYYAVLCIKNIKIKYGELNILIFSMLLMGISRNILIFGGMLIAVVYYCTMVMILNKRKSIEIYPLQ